MIWCLTPVVVALFLVGEVSAQDSQTVGSTTGSAPELAQPSSQVPPIRTDTARETMAGFLALRSALETAVAVYFQTSDRDHAVAVELISDQMSALIDLSKIPPSSRRAVGTETLSYLLDSLGRVPNPDLATFDIQSDAAGKSAGTFIVPETPFRITRMPEGPRAGEFLFSGRTVDTAPNFYRTVAHRPLHTKLDIKSWNSLMRQLAGPAIPAPLIAALPSDLKRSVFGTPIWKILLVLMITAASVAVLRIWHLVLKHIQKGNPVRRHWLGLLSPAAVLGNVLFLKHGFAFQINPTGVFSTFLDTIATVLTYVVLTWLMWGTIAVVAETLQRHPGPKGKPMDGNLLQLMSLVLSVIGSVLLLAQGGQELGFHIASILAGLGIGGLAIALAIRPTLENLIAGFVLFLDKPVRVGDLCSFGTSKGTVVQIGVRSIQIRALDRTLITIPNAQFADLQIVNWARCDKMLINQTIGLRYETSMDQLFFVLAGMREKCHAHPAIDSDTVRIRFSGYGDSALEIDLFIYALTHDFTEYFAIREDILLRLSNVVQEAGTGFAFPSRAIYMASDSDLDAELSAQATAKVQAWRDQELFPFPEFADTDLKRFQGNVDYPPSGSPDYSGPGQRKFAFEDVAAKPDENNEA